MQNEMRKMINSLERSILEEQLFVFLKFLETNGFLLFDAYINEEEDVTKDDIIQSVIFNFIMDYYGDVYEI